MNPASCALLLGFQLLAAPPVTPREDPRALMMQARACQRRAGGDDPERAEALYRRVISLEPRSSEAQLRLSEALLEQGKLEEAVAPAEKATQLSPRSSEAWAHLGILHYIRGRKNPEAQPKAMVALERAAKLLPVDVELWTRLAEVAETRKDEAMALKAWIQVGRLHPPMSFQGRTLEVIAWERSAALATSLKDYEARREAVLGLARQRYPEGPHLRALEDLARDQVQAGFLGHADESFSLLAEQLPREAAVWENIALVRLRAGRHEDALAALQKAEALRPTPQLTFNAAIALMNLGRFGEARERLLGLHQGLIAPDTDPKLRPAVLQLLGTCLLLQGRPTELLELAKGWPETETQPELAALKIQALTQTGALKPALEALRSGAARWPQRGIFPAALQIPAQALDSAAKPKKGSRSALVQLDIELMAGLHGEFRQWAKSLDFCLEAHKGAFIQPIELHLTQANALEQLDRPQEAIAVLREAQALKPDHPMLQNNLGYLLLEKGGDLAEAARLIESALKQDPNNASTLDSWGWVLFKQGHFQEAEKAFRKALDSSPDSPEMRRHLGETLLKLGKPREALEQWERALAYLFPERKELERRVRELRVQLARNPGEPEEQPDPEEPDESTEDER